MTGRPKCGATTRAGGRCGRPAGWGTDHPGVGTCKLHLGATPNHERAAQREQARQAVEAHGLPRDVDPNTALLEELCRTAGCVDFLVAAGATGPDHEWRDVLMEERKHFTAVARDCVRAKIDERMMTLAEREGARIAQLLEAILTELGLWNKPGVLKVVRKHLTRLASGA